ncbi:MAG TPA: hypothetical protein VMT56_04035 [Candidatus Bathyarchaeia archaeon]|nr:hypothetical protein [Candidatus Bathyarchaeia archaeon]
MLLIWEGFLDRSRRSGTTQHCGEEADRGEMLVEGTSAARVARTHGVNANPGVCWRLLYVAGRLGERTHAKSP